MKLDILKAPVLSVIDEKMQASAHNAASRDARVMRDEHDVQLTLLAAFEDAVGRKRPTKELHEIVHQLIDYSGVHFLSEELLMRMYAYPGYDDHEQRHNSLMEQMNALQESLLEAQPGDLLDIVGSLKSLLRGHMENDDALLSTYLKKDLKTVP